MSDRGTEWRTKPEFLAECLDCEWRSEERNAHGVAARHARSHKHTVRVEVVKVFIYEHGSRYA